MRTIIVNATALDASGALTILRQFVANIPQSDNTQWIVFVSEKIEIVASQSNVRIEPIAGVKSFIKRFMWDACGVKKWLKDNNITPSASVSLQNTNFRTGLKIPNYIYYHQSIPFFPKKWSPLKAEQRALWFYKNIYPFFVQIFLNKRTEIFVQLEYIKKGFAKRFNFNNEKIHVVSPTINLPDTQRVVKKTLSETTINLFYPATSHFYKNHKIVIDALNDKKNTNFVLYTTLKENELPYTFKQVKYLGRIPFDDVLSIYASCDALVFPSYIETFGLPLIEAASFGLPILVSDLPYAREVLEGYEGAHFIESQSVEDWVEGINKLVKNRKFRNFVPKQRASWSELLEIINTKNI